MTPRDEVDDHAPTPRIAPGLDGAAHIAALRPDAWDQDRHGADDAPNLGEFLRVSGADHDGTIALLVPGLGDTPRHDPVERFIPHQEFLELSATGVGGPDEDDRALVEALEERVQGLSAEIRGGP